MEGNPILARFRKSAGVAKTQVRALAHVSAFTGAGPYLQEAGRHPLPTLIAPGIERIELVTGGRGWVEHERVWIEVTAGSLVWNVAGDHTIARSDFADPYRCLAINFSVRAGGRRIAPRVTRWEDPAEVDSFAIRLQRMVADDDLDRDAVGAFVYARLLLQARLWAGRDLARPLPAPLRRVVDALDGRYAEDLDIDALAADAGWSPGHLHAMFRRHLGTSPHQYLLRRRIRAAREALAVHDQGLAGIAAATGFATPQALIRAFRRQLGTTPMAWRGRHAATSER